MTSPTEGVGRREEGASVGAATTHHRTLRGLAKPCWAIDGAAQEEWLLPAEWGGRTQC